MAKKKCKDCKRSSCVCSARSCPMCKSLPCNCSPLAWLLIILGVLFLLRDVGVWHMWGISGWTVAFVLAGLYMLCGTKCC